MGFNPASEPVIDVQRGAFLQCNIARIAATAIICRASFTNVLAEAKTITGDIDAIIHINEYRNVAPQFQR